MPLFVQMVRPLGDMSALDAAQEQAMAAHFERLQRDLGADGVLLAGPCADAAFGLVLFQATDLAAAQRWAEADPAVVAGVMSSEVHTFRLSLCSSHWPAPAYPVDEETR